MIRLKKIPFTAILPGIIILASATCILATDLYVPSLPHISDYFGTSDHKAQLTMSLHLLGFGLAQLIYGPLSDAWGRRPIILFGSALFFIASLMCAMAPNIETLIIARLLQGLGGAAIAVLGMVIVREVYKSEQQSVRIITLLAMVVALAPAVGPIIGGHIYVWFGWRANFYFLSAFGLLSVVCLYFLLQETLLKPNSKAIQLKYILHNYGALLKNATFVSYVIILACIFSGLFTFITQAPFLLIKQLGVLEENYGYYQGGIVVAYIVGNMISRSFVRKYSLNQIMTWGVIGIVLGAIGLVFVALNPPLVTPVNLCIPVAIYTGSLGAVFATAATRALSVPPEIRGSASALLGAAEMGLAALAAFIASQTYDHTARPMAFVIAGASFITMAAFMYIRYRKLDHTLPQD